jgi:hypothetical protein
MFVLLEHTAREGVHWDFIIEVPGRELLPTWRLLENPLETSRAIPAEPIADHSPHFLEYEGPLREGRGSVRRLDRGAAAILRFDSRGLGAELGGDRMRGRIEITTEADGRVHFCACDRLQNPKGV